MLKKLLFHILLIITAFNACPLSGSSIAKEQTTQSKSSSSSPKKLEGILWSVGTYLVVTGATIASTPVLICTAAGTTVLCAGYGGYQLWRKFIFDEQLRAMKEELMREMARSTQDGNNHVTHEVHASERRQAQHTTTQLQVLRTDLIQHATTQLQASENRQMQHVTVQSQLLRTDLMQRIGVIENNLMQRVDNNSHDTQAGMDTLREQQNALHIQMATYHQALIARLDRNQFLARLPYFPATHFIKKTPDEPSSSK